jgi:hypothetical protein
MAYHIAYLILITAVELLSAGDNVYNAVISSNKFSADFSNNVPRGWLIKVCDGWRIARVPEDRLLCTSLGCLVAVALHGDRTAMMTDW